MLRIRSAVFRQSRGVVTIASHRARRAPPSGLDAAIFDATAFRGVRCFGRRALRRTTTKRPASKPLSADAEVCIEGLQGSWGDDTGLTIEVSGREAHFSDKSEPYTFEAADSAVALRGARLTGTVAAPVWTFPDGVRRNWARVEAAGSGDSVWALAFLGFQEQRLRIRRNLRDAFAENDFDAVATLKLEWRREGEVKEGLTEEQSAALVSGQRLVPGSCFRHKKFKYRGIILASDPWCAYPASWRAMWLPNRPQAERQPFYYCLVDERDRKGTQMRYVAQDNVEECDVVFPVESRAASMFLSQHNELGCYLPGSELEEMLRVQRADSSHVFSLRRS